MFEFLWICIDFWYEWCGLGIIHGSIMFFINFIWFGTIFTIWSWFMIIVANWTKKHNEVIVFVIQSRFEWKFTFEYMFQRSFFFIRAKLATRGFWEILQSPIVCGDCVQVMQHESEFVCHSHSHILIMPQTAARTCRRPSDPWLKAVLSCAWLHSMFWMSDSEGSHGLPSVAEADSNGIGIGLETQSFCSAKPRSNKPQGGKTSWWPVQERVSADCVLWPFCTSTLPCMCTLSVIRLIAVRSVSSNPNRNQVRAFIHVVIMSFCCVVQFACALHLLPGIQTWCMSSVHIVHACSLKVMKWTVPVLPDSSLTVPW